MKKISLFVVVIAFVLCVASLSFGQTKSGATAVIPSVYYEILDQPDCPLNIGIDESLAARMSVAPLNITNADSSNINAYILHVNGGPRLDRSYMVFVHGKGLAPGKSSLRVISVRAMSENEVKPVISIDYVHFADGKTWGADSLGKSKDVKAFLGGHDLASSRLKELLVDKDDTEFIKVIEIGSSSFGEMVPSRRKLDFFAKGYEDVINRLRRMKKSVDEAKELARKLEVMQPSR